MNKGEKRGIVALAWSLWLLILSCSSGAYAPGVGILTSAGGLIFGIILLLSSDKE